MQRNNAGARMGSSIALALALAFTGWTRADEPASRPATGIDQSDLAPDLDPSIVPDRPRPPIEIGDHFFGTGPLQHGIELPTGAVWTPNFTVFGTFRSAAQGFHDSQADKTRSEWANRLDLFGNLQLTGTERVLIGFRPFDDGVFARPARAKYSGYQFSPDGTDGWIESFNIRPTTFFFEGDLGQLFPHLDPDGTHPMDIGFCIGRQALKYQDGLLIDDDIDAIGITRNTFIPHGSTNVQITAIYGWDQINRGDGINHGDHALAGLFFNADFKPITWNLDLVYVDGRGQDPDGAYLGLSAARRFGKLNTTFHVLASQVLGSYSKGPANPLSAFGNGSSLVGNGVLLFSEMSYTIPKSNDLLYLDSYWGIDRFTSAARGPDRGGPLGRVGILFAEQPIGRYGSALSSDPERSVGFALGYQKFIDPARRQQLILEAGGRIGTGEDPHGALATGFRYQHAFGQHTVMEVGSFIALNEGEGLGFGGRVEFHYEF